MVAIGRAVLRTMPPETAKPVTGRVWWKIAALCCAGTRTAVTFPPTNRLVGTKTYCVSRTTIGRPE